MHTIHSLLQMLESISEDLYHIHQKLIQKLDKYDENNDGFDDNHRALVAVIDNNSNAISGIYKNVHLQRQLDVLAKIITSIPPEIRAQYVHPSLLEMLGE